MLITTVKYKFDTWPWPLRGYIYGFPIHFYDNKVLNIVCYALLHPKYGIASIQYSHST